MPEESTTPDLVELVRSFFAAANQPANLPDVAAGMSFFAPDAVWDSSALGIGTFQGVAAIRGVLEDWLGSYDEFEISLEEINDLGSGVTFAVGLQRGRVAGTDATVQERRCYTGVWEGGVISRIIVSADIDEARADAERLAGAG